MLTVTLDDKTRCAIAHLAPSESLIVAAPPAEVEITGKDDQPWVWLRFDDFGVRTHFGKNLFGTISGLNRRDGLYKHAMAAGESVHEGGVARILGHLEGAKHRPVWVPDGFEVVTGDQRPRLDPMVEFESMLAELAAEGLSISGVEALRLFRLARAAA